MPPISVMIKPASGSCNMRCKYCFYADEMENRAVKSYGIMSEDILETVIQKILAHANGQCTIGFQGGEPTLAGLDFFKKVIEFESKYNVNRVKIHNTLQTNGLLIDDAFAKFLAEHHFLVGLSLDGTKEIHDLYRLDATEKSTWIRVLHAAELFDKYHVEYNILTVVTAQTAKNIGKIYRFFKKHNMRYQQYIPCLDPLLEGKGKHSYSLTPPLYERFLKTLFDLWYQDYLAKDYVYIRYFENLIGMMLGHPPESCGLSGICSVQYIIEADSGVYPCDFYMLDDYKIGNLSVDSMDEIDKKRKQIGFIEKSFEKSEKCNSCSYRLLCNGGCVRDRIVNADGTYGQNYYCDAYYNFFEYVIERMTQICRTIR